MLDIELKRASEIKDRIRELIRKIAFCDLELKSEKMGIRTVDVYVLLFTGEQAALIINMAKASFEIEKRKLEEEFNLL